MIVGGKVDAQLRDLAAPHGPWKCRVEADDVLFAGMGHWPKDVAIRTVNLCERDEGPAKIVTAGGALASPGPS